MLTKILEDYGLSRKEAQIYLSLLESGPLTANALSKKTTINRSTIYVLAETLRKKGLVNSILLKKIQCFVAVSPSELLRLAKSRSQKYAKLVKDIEHIQPALKSLGTISRNLPKIILTETNNNSLSKNSDEFKIENDSIIFSSKLDNFTLQIKHIGIAKTCKKLISRQFNNKL